MIAFAWSHSLCLTWRTNESTLCPSVHTVSSCFYLGKCTLQQVAPILRFELAGASWSNGAGENPPYELGSFAKVVTRDTTPAAGAAEGCTENMRAAWAAMLERTSTESEFLLLDLRGSMFYTVAHPVFAIEPSLAAYLSRTRQG